MRRRPSHYISTQLSADQQAMSIEPDVTRDEDKAIYRPSAEPTCTTGKSGEIAVRLQSAEPSKPPTKIGKPAQEGSKDADYTEEDLRLVFNFAQTTLAKGIQGLVKGYKKEKRENNWELMTVFTQPNNKAKNRYKDVGCLDSTRVQLKYPGKDYIHANYVSVLGQKKFICAQAPLPGTIGDFWHMIVQERCGQILMLCNFKEMNAAKCAEYFPQTVTKALQLQGVTVNAKKISKYNWKTTTSVQVIVTELEVSLATQPLIRHRCTHYRWKDWPDRGTPPADEAPIELCKMLTRAFKKDGRPIVVHCSAGIGRTGALVLIDVLMEMLAANKPWNADALPYLREIRCQRNNSIQTEHQYLFVHMVALKYISTHFVIKDNKFFKMLDAFTQEYNTYCKAFQQ